MSVAPEILETSVGPMQVTSDANQVNILDNDNRNRAKVEFWIAKRLGTRLTELYPNREWGIHIDFDGGMVDVLCPSVSQIKAYRISLMRTLEEIYQMMPAVGGEILERAGLGTGKKFNPDDIEIAPRDFRDEVVTSDLLAPEEKRVLTKR